MVNPHAKPPTPTAVHQCGIYAPNLWRESGLDDIGWIPKSPRGVVNSGTELRSSHSLCMLAPGDILIDDQPTLESGGEPILVDGKKQFAFHHVLILKIAPDGKFAGILQGKSGPYPKDQSLVTHVMRQPLPQLSKRSASHEFISVATAMHRGVNYG